MAKSKCTVSNTPCDRVQHFGIVSRIPDSMKKKVENDECILCGGEFDLDLARRQHEKYIVTMRKLKVNMFELEADEDTPLCCFLDRCAVVQDGIAVICNKPANRTQADINKEVDVVRRVLSFDLGQKVVDMAEVEGATLDGGDVLFTGKEFFVGLSKRTNMKGALFLADTFSNYPVSPIKLSDGSLHLKSFMSMAAPEVIAVGSSKEAQKALKEIECKATFTYRKITLPDDGAANCVYVNKTLIHCSHEDFPESVKKFEELFGHTLNRIEMPNSEFKKVDGALTCRSILIQKKPKA
ncbi:N(G),N(G)-dimethylarginine dimethylaminohydrolase 1-like isoform X1 [Lytechinus variegatus]|uniref:N(G),N(G)-dimethylarginine dimethylaminohydrolase 1-like isoform X1 n=1 Tax=Lytechinus variegatus TaxID=7654 RepID=UPI001BB0F8C2|nr:N(G),N(G)-dimethylarginine dimethylaminohydrolase 1-like isoform X1 [Lytechinus variegatus]